MSTVHNIANGNDMATTNGGDIYNLQTRNETSSCVEEPSLSGMHDFQLQRAPAC